MPKQNNNILITFIISLSSICQTLSFSTLSLSQFVFDFSRLPLSVFGEGVGAALKESFVGTITEARSSWSRG